MQEDIDINSTLKRKNQAQMCMLKIWGTSSQDGGIGRYTLSMITK